MRLPFHSPRTIGLAAAAGYAALAAILTWPLVQNMATMLPGDPTGDTGVYVWNLWVFRHELVWHGRLPFSTEHVFAFTGGADFSLHNYTPIAGLLATVLIPLAGVVASFNLAMLSFLVVTGLAVYLLGRQVGLGRGAAWVAGALFIASPVMTARQTAHLSLVSAAPLPLFLWALLKTIDDPRGWKGAALGAIVALATYADAYFGIYCVLMGAFVLAWRFLRLRRQERLGAGRAGAVRWLDSVLLLIVLVVAWRLVTGPTAVFLGPLRISLSAFYTPVLLLVVLAGVRAWLTWPVALHVVRPHEGLAALARSGLLSVLACLVLLSPLLAGLAMRYSQGRLPATTTFWRSSPRGVDLLAYFVPNPNHPWFGHLTERWLLPDSPDAFPEYVASFSLVALAVIVLAGYRRRLPPLWVAFTAAFGLLSLGPFIHAGTANTYVIGPWVLLRYLPVIGMARSPSRMAIVATLGLSILFAFAVQGWVASRRRGALAAAGLAVSLVAFEVLPAPRRLYPADVPAVYRMVAAAMEDEQGRLLELPSGIRDGTSSVGDFNAASAFYQTTHRRPLIGGYLSRVSEWRRQQSRRMPILRGIYALSEGPGPLPEDLVREAREARDAFLRRSCLKYVIVDKARASDDLRAFAVDVIRLRPVHEDDRYELLSPADPPPCEPRESRRRSWSTPGT